MRPVNLIPREDRRGQHGPMRSGPLVYILIGALVAALAGVTALVLTENQIVNLKSEVAQLHREDAVVHARARRLAAYSQFRTVKEQRVATVTSLADSRFDWERVMRELSRVLPANVWLTNLVATDSPKVSLTGASSGGGSGSSGTALRSNVNGPAMEMSGCTEGQDGVAGFVTALKEIDGVTRVGVESSKLPNPGSGAGTNEGSGANSQGSGGGSASAGCVGKLAQFEIVVAFDAAPIPSASSESSAATPTATKTAESTASSTTASTSTSGGG